MSSTRCKLLVASAATAGALGFGSLSAGLAAPPPGEASKSLSLLIPGGTGFIGPYMVAGSGDHTDRYTYWIAGFDH